MGIIAFCLISSHKSFYHILFTLKTQSKLPRLELRFTTYFFSSPGVN